MRQKYSNNSQIVKSKIEKKKIHHNQACPDRNKLKQFYMVTTADIPKLLYFLLLLFTPTKKNDGWQSSTQHKFNLGRKIHVQKEELVKL